MFIVAHRAGTDYFPELTLAGAKKSLNLGADYVEIDVRFTKDNVAVICHDADTLSSFGIDKQVQDYMYEEFRNLTYKDNDTLQAASLEDYFKGDLKPLLLHVKEGGEEAMNVILNLMAKYHYHNHVILGLTNVSDIQYVKQYHKDIKILGFVPQKSDIPTFLEQDVEIIRLWEDWVEPQIVDLIHQSGKKVWVMSGSPQDKTIGFIEKSAIKKLIENYRIDGLLIDHVEGLKTWLVNNT